MNYHPAVMAALEAVRDACRRGVQPDVARKAVRVEIARDLELELQMERYAASGYYEKDLKYGRPPLRFMDISFYAVDDLPTRTWQVIAPFDYLRSSDFVASCDKILSHDAPHPSAYHRK